MKNFLKQLFNRPKREKNLLVIKVKDVGSSPVIIYEGENIEYKQEVDFTWTTTVDDGFSGGYDFEIKHYKKDKKNSRVLTKGFKSPFL